MRTEFKDYARPTGQTFRQRHEISLGGVLVITIVVGVIWLLAWGAIHSLDTPEPATKLDEIHSMVPDALQERETTPWVIPWIWGEISPDITPSEAADSLYQYFLHERGQYQ